MMYDSLSVIDEIEKKESIKIDRHVNLLEYLKEINLRRNAYVHTGGCVNKDYFKRAPKQYSEKKKEGDVLLCTKKYCDDAICTISLIIFSITYELLVRFDATPSDIENLSNHLFERLVECDYALCKDAYFIMTKHKASDNSHIMAYRVNYLNCLKQLGLKDLLANELERLDVSDLSDMYVIAKECLSDNNERVFDLLCKSYPSSFDAVSIRKWPIFIDFRKTEYYERFMNMHKEDFAVDVVESQPQPGGCVEFDK